MTMMAIETKSPLRCNLFAEFFVVSEVFSVELSVVFPEYKTKNYTRDPQCISLWTLGWSSVFEFNGKNYL